MKRWLFIRIGNLFFPANTHDKAEDLWERVDGKFLKLEESDETNYCGAARCALSGNLHCSQPD